ncbi:MAG: DUF2070 family protein [Candidatus Nanohaloarchaeota archaeon QJJ-7]|nr:DUF2070 family protein [Candidatus Nanohaloarchaeota archaeon QJJ-7]
MSDNLGFAEKILFRPPSSRRMAVYNAVLGIVFGALTTFVLSPTSDLSLNIIGGAVVAFFFYLVPALLFSETVTRVGGLNRKWSYIITIIDQAVVFFFSLTVPFTETATEAWQVMWLALATVFAINFFLILASRGKRSMHWNLVYAAIYPVTVLAAFHVFIGRLVGIPRSLYLQNSVFFLISAFLLLLTIAIFDYLIRSNVELSFYEFSSNLLLKQEKALEGGAYTDVYHQSLRIDNGEELRYNVPWIHPGPVEGFGGGRLTSELITGDDFLLHVPSYHTIDLADPQDIDLFREPPGAEKSGEATRMLKHESGDFTLYGRRYSNGTAVFVENRNVDDYEPSIAYDLKEEFPELMLIDLHNQGRREGERWLQHMEKEAEELEEGVREIVERLEDEELKDYKAGFAGNHDYQALVEEVGDQRTVPPEENGARTPSLESDGVQSVVLLGIDGNDALEFMHDLVEELEHDRSLVFTTDSHENLLELASPREYTEEGLREAVEEAEEDLSDAEAGIGEELVEDVRVLGKDYEALITTLNIMARLLPITLMLYYVAIVFLIL